MSVLPADGPAAGYSRRRFISLALSCGACAACGDGPPPVKDSGLSAGDGGEDGAGEGVPDESGVCEPADTALDASWVAVPLVSYPALAEVGGSAAVDLGGKRLVLGQPSAGCFAAVDRACTHQGCDLYHDGGRFLCPCHGASFGLDGAVISGPTPIPVNAYRAALRGEIVWVQLAARR